VLLPSALSDLPHPPRQTRRGGGNSAHGPRIRRWLARARPDTRAYIILYSFSLCFFLFVSAMIWQWLDRACTQDPQSEAQQDEVPGDTGMWPPARRSKGWPVLGRRTDGQIWQPEFKEPGGATKTAGKTLGNRSSTTLAATTRLVPRGWGAGAPGARTPAPGNRQGGDSGAAGADPGPGSTTRGARLAPGRGQGEGRAMIHLRVKRPPKTPRRADPEDGRSLWALRRSASASPGTKGHGCGEGACAGA